MSTFKTSTHAPFRDPGWPLLEGARPLIAWSLLAASAVLSRLAAHLLRPASRASHEASQLEFHADAHGCDGALYLDGVWVGRIAGVTRL